MLNEMQGVASSVAPLCSTSGPSYAEQIGGLWGRKWDDMWR